MNADTYMAMLSRHPRRGRNTTTDMDKAEAESRKPKDVRKQETINKEQRAREENGRWARTANGTHIPPLLRRPPGQ